ncbi:MAG: hypothetical protein HYZ90_04680 [Candidatus Omnitrophica bacterium]|nr:hypothetical protein [Candidatus Omnitrophota bacterium]
MDRKVLIGLFLEGMRYPRGKHQLWVERCLELNVRPDEVVELDEYEDFSTQKKKTPPAARPRKGGAPREMFHVGRSVLHLKEGRVIEKEGSGWPDRKKS